MGKSISELFNPKKTAARRMEEAESSSGFVPDADPAGEAPKKGAMTQSDFSRKASPEQRQQQQQALARKLRSLGQ